MTLTNSHNSHNSHNSYNSHNSHSGQLGVTEVDQALMAEALTIAREGVVNAGPPKANTFDRKELSPAMRLRRIEYEFAQSILLSEMLDGLSWSPAKDQPLPKIELVAGVGKQEKQLLSLTLPSDKDFADELQLVMGYATLRNERLAEVTTQTSDILTFLMSILPIPLGRTRMLNYLMDLAMNLSTSVVQGMKLGFDAPRPNVLSSQVQPMIATPLHASYPSGHATQAFAVAMLLTILTREDRHKPAEISPDSQLFRMAARIAINRTVAGVHFPSDSAAGALLGITLARWIAVRAKADHPDCLSMEFTATEWGNTAPDGSRDFYLGRLCELLRGHDPKCLKIGSAVTWPHSELISGVWEMAEKEWSERWS